SGPRRHSPRPRVGVAETRPEHSILQERCVWLEKRGVEPLRLSARVGHVTRVENEVRVGLQHAIPNGVLAGTSVPGVTECREAERKAGTIGLKNRLGGKRNTIRSGDV